jgi:hypothetical protein
MPKDKLFKLYNNLIFFIKELKSFISNIFKSNKEE